MTVLCPWARHIYPSLVLVQPSKTRPCLTEILLMGCKESNQAKITVTYSYVVSSFLDCNDPPTPLGGSVDFPDGTTYLSEATYSCDLGYTMNGSPASTCQADKTWSNVDPVCTINGRLYQLLITLNWESLAQFENRIKPQVYGRGLRKLLCIKKLHFIFRNRCK